MAETLDATYEKTSEQSISIWDKNPDTGLPGKASYHPTLLGVSSGNLAGPHEDILPVLDAIGTLCAGDAQADVIPRSQLHFTFLALAPHNYGSIAELPPVHQLHGAYSCCQDQSFTIRDLRLVALPNALLLAGIPALETANLRRIFVERLLASQWSPHLKARYGSGGPLPPRFWHTTLVRYNAERLPIRLRHFFLENRLCRYNSVCLPIRLVATTYDWRIVYDL